MKALDDFNLFLDGVADPLVATHHRFEHKPADAEAALEAVARRAGMPLPPALAHLLATEGAFHNPWFGDVWQTLRLDSAAELLERRTGLATFIDDVWAGRPELHEWFGAEALSQIDAQTFVFGFRYEDDNVHDYLYFDRRGRFDHLYFDQDSPRVARSHLTSILREPGPGVTLEELLASQLEIMMMAIQEG
jgi:hypothetical protein